MCNRSWAQSIMWAMEREKLKHDVEKLNQWERERPTKYDGHIHKWVRIDKWHLQCTVCGEIIRDL